MHAGGFRFYRSCLSDVRRRQWRKTGEWRLTCRIRRLRQPPREVSPVSGGSVSSPPSSPPTQILLCDSQEYKPSSDMLPKDLGMGFLSVWGRPPLVVCAAGPRCLRSLPVGWHVWGIRNHVVIAHEHDRRVRVFQSCLISVHRAPGNEGGWPTNQRVVTACGRCSLQVLRGGSSCIRGGMRILKPPAAPPQPTRDNKPHYTGLTFRKMPCDEENFVFGTCGWGFMCTVLSAGLSLLDTSRTRQTTHAGT